MAFESIWLATDLREDAVFPWAHALKICSTSKKDLQVLHIQSDTEPRWELLPTPRRLLTTWNLLPADATVEEFNALGFKIHFKALEAQHPTGLLGALIEVEAPDLLVLGSHRPTGLDRLFSGSVAEDLARRSPGATLLIPTGVHPFVEPSRGVVSLRRVLIPIGDTSAAQALSAVLDLRSALKVESTEILFVFVGPASEVPELEISHTQGLTYRTIRFDDGPVVKRILQASESEDVDLIAMSTRGHDSWWKTLTGSRTERVLRESAVPLLMVTAS